MAQLRVETRQTCAQRRSKKPSFALGDDATTECADYDLDATVGSILFESDRCVDVATRPTLDASQAALDAQLHARRDGGVMRVVVDVHGYGLCAMGYGTTATLPPHG